MGRSPSWPFHPLALFVVLNRAILALTIGLVLVAVHRYCWLDAPDPFKCGALLNHGQWLESSALARERPFQNWQPAGCMMHEYNARDIHFCLRSKRILFVGDSTTRQVFWAIAKKLDMVATRDLMLHADKHSDIEFFKDKVNVTFIWDPFLNSSRLCDELQSFRDGSLTTHSTAIENPQSAAVILIGAGLWFARHVDINHIKAFKDAVDRVVPYMNNRMAVSSDHYNSILSKVNISANLLLFAPVQSPWYPSLSPARAKSLTPQRINKMNEYLRHLSAFQRADVTWSFSLMTHEEGGAYEEDGLHVVDNIASRRADVLLNLKCNSDASGSQGQGYPYDKSCCSNYRYPGWLQWTVFFATLSFLSVLARFTFLEHHSRINPPYKVLRASSVISLALCYCYCADRTQVFDKSHKQYSSIDFLSLCSISLVLGLVSIRRSRMTTRQRGSEGGALDSQNESFMSRDQTEEWKGWMQSLILIYHYTGASKVIWIYPLIRIMVASYLFMTGFGHTLYFYHKGDYSIRRVASILVRLNLLSCLLPYMMRTDYLFYYFAPLVSYWFLVVYITMRIGRDYNSSPKFVLSKIVISALIVATFNKLEGPLEFIFTALKYTCKIDWDVAEWRFRISLDIFIVYFGMCFALVLAKSPMEWIPRFGNYNSPFRRFKGFPVLFCFITLLCFALFLNGFDDKYEYNQWHPFVSFIPITCFLLLRNSHRHLRNFHSSVFAWLGRCSLETFTLQFHIWLAGDTKGLLRLGVFGRRGLEFAGGKWEEFVLITIVFLWVSWCVAGASGTLTKWILETAPPKDLAGVAVTLELTSMPQSTVVDGSSPQPNSPGTTAACSGKFDGWKGSIVSRWREDIKVRLIALLLGLWILNKSYN
ncbi:MAG: hypothetical protein M1829_005320 [Trizodia sp. TS-e1964]|nr:MAG: hypothetical protein M1829_005320 [Trizodia sp. TS-e1964]